MQKATKRRWWPIRRPPRRFFVVSGLLAGAVALVVLLWPVGLRYTLETALETDGHRTVQVDDVELNPFTGRTRLTGLRIQTAGGSRTVIGRAEAKLDLAGLWQRRLHVETLIVEDASTDVERRRDGTWRLAGFDVAPTQAPADGGAVWDVGATSVALDRILVTYRRDGMAQALSIDRLRVSDIATWRATEPSALVRTREPEIAMHCSSRTRSLRRLTDTCVPLSDYWTKPRLQHVIHDVCRSTIAPNASSL